jgi:hypothetical protein
MWDQNDKNGFIIESNKHVGQVKNNSLLANIINKLCNEKDNKTFLEIGTWNGYGSTKIFVNSLSNRTDTLFYSLECNKEKSEFASNLYKDKHNVFILNETINKELPNDISLIFPELLNNKQYSYWNEVDVNNMKQCNLFLERKDIPDIFDVIFLDGGEFTTYYEFQILKTKCKYLLLDDTNTNKCKKIVDEIYSNKNKWEILVHNKNERNGILLCKFKFV